MYACYLVFQLYTHRDLFVSEESDEEPALSLVAATSLLASISVIVAFSSEVLTGAIEDLSETSGLS